jgi:hypothetical protein
MVGHRGTLLLQPSDVQQLVAPDQQNTVFYPGHHAGRRITAKFPKVGNLTLLERPLHPFALVSVMRVALLSRVRQYEVRDLLERLEASQGELQDKIHDLEQFEDAVIGRELKMIELERQIEELRARSAGAECQ